jgi:hypothetical protein
MILLLCSAVLALDLLVISVNFLLDKKAPQGKCLSSY